MRGERRSIRPPLCPHRGSNERFGLRTRCFCAEWMMMDDKETPETKPEAPVTETPEAAASAGDTAVDPRDAELKAGRAAFDALVAENADLKDRLLRTVAE